MKKLAVQRHPLFVLPMLEHSIHSIFPKMSWEDFFYPNAIRLLYRILLLHGKAAEHFMIIKTDGSLWGFGRNDAGQLGDGTTTNEGHTDFLDYIFRCRSRVACGTSILWSSKQMEVCGLLGIMAMVNSEMEIQLIEVRRCKFYPVVFPNCLLGIITHF